MAQYEDRALVLHIANYRESSALIHLVTEHEGRISLVARGLHGKKTGAPGASAIMQPFNLVRVRFSLKEGSTIGNMISAELERAAVASHESIAAYGLISFWFEILRETAQERGTPGTLFSLTRTMLDDQHDQPGLSKDYVRLLLGLAAALGFAVTWDRCVICGQSRRHDKPPAYFSNRHGGVVCSPCATAGNEESSFNLHPEESAAIVTFGTPADKEKAADQRLAGPELLALLGLIHRFLSYHIEHPLRTFQFVRDTVGSESAPPDS